MPVVNIQLFEGRDKVKEDIAKAITELLSEKAGVEAKYVYIIFNDVKKENWSIGGEMASTPAE